MCLLMFLEWKFENAKKALDVEQNARGHRWSQTRVRGDTDGHTKKYCFSIDFGLEIQKCENSKRRKSKMLKKH